MRWTVDFMTCLKSQGTTMGAGVKRQPLLYGTLFADAWPIYFN